MRYIIFLSLIAASISSVVDVVLADDISSIIDRQRREISNNAHSSMFCYKKSDIKVVDTSQPIDQNFIDLHKGFGVEVVARYYGYTHQNLPPNVKEIEDSQSIKVITPIEVGILVSNKVSSIVAFQYHNSSEQTFADWQVRAPADAKRALQLANELGQPLHTTIYFGADGDFVHALKRPCKKTAAGPGNCTKEILSYFSIVSDIANKGGYNVGVYGSGATCLMLTKAKKVDKCWLDFSPGHTGRSEGLNDEKTVLIQLSEAKTLLEQRKCGRPIDFDRIKARDFGQFIYEPRKPDPSGH